MGLSQRRTALLARLRVRRQRERERLVLVEGVRAVTEALDAGVRARFAVVSERLVATPAGRALGDRLREAATEVETVDVASFSDIASTESPQGVLIVCEQEEADLNALVVTEGPLLVLDALQDPGNVGTLIRSAVAFGFAGVIALDGATDPWGAKVVRASAGTVVRAAVVRAQAADAIVALRGAGRAILVASADGGSLAEVSERGSVALVIGNEGAGVRDEVRAEADASISIRMHGPVESLNAGIAGSILMHELTRE